MATKLLEMFAVFLMVSFATLCFDFPPAFFSSPSSGFTTRAPRFGSFHFFSLLLIKQQPPSHLSNFQKFYLILEVHLGWHPLVEVHLCWSFALRVDWQLDLVPYHPLQIYLACTMPRTHLYNVPESSLQSQHHQVNDHV